MVEEKKEVKKEKEKERMGVGLFIFIGCVAFMIGIAVGALMEYDYDIGGNKGVLLTIRDAKPGAIYNKIEHQGFCIMREEGSEDDKKAYVLPWSPPPRFIIAKSGEEYEIVPAPLPIEKK